MRHDDVLLVDMQAAAATIAEHIADMTKDQFLADRKTQDAVERQILTLGEAASRVSQGFRDANPQMPWRRLVVLRNFYVHAYHRVDPLSVWGTATGLVRRVAGLLDPLAPATEESE